MIKFIKNNKFMFTAMVIIGATLIIAVIRIVFYGKFLF
jgi:hypothetical protein